MWYKGTMKAKKIKRIVGDKAGAHKRVLDMIRHEDPEAFEEKPKVTRQTVQDVLRSVSECGET